MRFVFIIQGEGRGHMTQAVSLKTILESRGHTVEKVLIGSSEGRSIPRFIQEEFKGRSISLPSPNFVLDRKGRKVRLAKTIVRNLLKLPLFMSSVRKVREVLEEIRPDMVVNFYDVLGGLTYYFYSPEIPFVCVGHQYLTLHPDFPFPRGGVFQRQLLKWHTRLTAIKAHKILALSFRDMPDKADKRLVVTPPLLRKMVLDTSPQRGNFILGYLLNKAYAEEVIAWHRKDPAEKAHFFWDNQEAQEETLMHRNLIFHRLSDTKFIDFMSKCKGVVTTAGFESVCEAMYMGKPVLMVPTLGHYEQQCNAVDAIISGAGIQATSFEIERLVDYIPKHQQSNWKFRKWVDNATGHFLFHLVESRASFSSSFEPTRLLAGTIKELPLK